MGTHTCVYIYTHTRKSGLLFTALTQRWRHRRIRSSCHSSWAKVFLQNCAWLEVTMCPVVADTLGHVQMGRNWMWRWLAHTSVCEQSLSPWLWLGYVGLLSLTPSTSYTQTAWYLRQQGADKGFSWLTFRVTLCFPQVLPSCLVLCFCSLDCLYVMLCI